MSKLLKDFPELKGFRLSFAAFAFPSILRLENNSVDIHWKTKKFELLLNIPKDWAGIPTFYGDNYKTKSIKGQFNKKSNVGYLLMFLFE